MLTLRNNDLRWILALATIVESRNCQFWGWHELFFVTIFRLLFFLCTWNPNFFFRFHSGKFSSAAPNDNFTIDVIVAIVIDTIAVHFNVVILAAILPCHWRHWHCCCHHHRHCHLSSSCSLAVNLRNLTKASQGGITHGMGTERLPIYWPYGGRRHC